MVACFWLRLARSVTPIRTPTRTARPTTGALRLRAAPTRKRLWKRIIRLGFPLTAAPAKIMHLRILVVISDRRVENWRASHPHQEEIQC